VALITLVAGQKFRTDTEIDTLCLTSYLAPYTGGCEVTLPVGFEFEIMHDPVEGAPGVGCLALDYDRYEKLLVPTHERADGKYSGYHIVMMLTAISNQCEPITDAT